MTEILFDGQKLDIDQNTEIDVTIGIDSVNDPSNSSVSFSKTIKIPMTDRNRMVLGFVEQIMNPQNWNNREHVAEIISDGFTIMKGQPVMSDINTEMSKQSYYSFNIIGEEIEWVKQAEAPMSSLESSFGVEYDESNILDSVLYYSQYNPDSMYRIPNPILPVSEYPLIRFIPVDRGGYWVKDENDEYVPRTKLCLEDYYPFLNVRAVLEAIFKGYTIKSSMLDQFARLYFPGKLEEMQDVDLIEESNTFCAGSDPDKQEADIYIFPMGDAFICSVSPSDNKEYFGNDVASITSNNRLVYRPKNDCTLQFELYVKFSYNLPGVFISNSDYSAPSIIHISPPTLSVLDMTIADNDGSDSSSFSWPLMDDNTLLGESFTPGLIPSRQEYWDFYFEIFDVKKYSCLEMDYSVDVYVDPETGYRPTLRRLIIDFDNNPCYAGKIDGYANAPDFYLKTNSGERILLTDKNMNTYGRFFTSITSGGTIDIEKTITTKSLRLSEGVESRIMVTACTTRGTLRLKSLEAKLVPVFNPGLAYGEPVTIADVGGETSQIDLLADLRSLFNLSIYTNSRSKEIFIEPKTTFYNDVLVDITKQVDFSQPIIVSEAGADMGSYLELKYGEGNDIIKRLNFKNRSELGACKINLASKAKTEGTSITAGIFQPITTRGIAVKYHADQPEVIVPMLQFVSEKEQSTIEECDFGIDPVIVELAEIQSGTFNSQYGVQKYYYPIVRFSEDNTNLSFADAGNIKGLSQYYTDNIDIYNNGKIITCYVRWSQGEIENILYPNSNGQDFRALYKLEINGEEILCRLEKISDYDPKKPSTKTQFIRWVKRE